MREGGGGAEGGEGERQSVPSHGRASEHQEGAGEGGVAMGKGRARLMELKV